MSKHLPQPIVTPISEAAIFLVLTIEHDCEDAARETLTEVSGLKRSVGFRIPEAMLTCVVGIGSDLWDRLFDGPRPAELHPFKQIDGAKTAPSTPGDLLFHIRAHRFDLCFELARRIVEAFGSAAKVVDEVHGFRSFDERDLLGFVDGTENPELPDEAAEVVLIGDEDPEFAGGSYVIVQKYFHDLHAWDALSTEEQELAIGRTKLDDIEMPDDQKPANSHLALNVIEDENGDEQQIYRLNMPFGEIGAGEFGTYFIGYARTPTITETMLNNMFVGKPAGTYDRLLDFSVAQTGGLFFVPGVGFLDGA